MRVFVVYLLVVDEEDELAEVVEQGPVADDGEEVGEREEGHVGLEAAGVAARLGGEQGGEVHGHEQAAQQLLAQALAQRRVGQQVDVLQVVEVVDVLVDQVHQPLLLRVAAQARVERSE